MCVQNSISITQKSMWIFCTVLLECPGLSPIVVSGSASLLTSVSCLGSFLILFTLLSYMTQTLFTQAARSALRTVQQLNPFKGQSY